MKGLRVQRNVLIGVKRNKPEEIASNFLGVAVLLTRGVGVDEAARQLVVTQAAY